MELDKEYTDISIYFPNDLDISEASMPNRPTVKCAGQILLISTFHHRTFMYYGCTNEYDYSYKIKTTIYKFKENDSDNYICIAQTKSPSAIKVYFVDDRNISSSLRINFGALRKFVSLVLSDNQDRTVFKLTKEYIDAVPMSTFEVNSLDGTKKINLKG